MGYTGIGVYLYSTVRKGRRYWYLRKKERVKGVPTVVLNKYLGTDEEIIQRLQGGADRLEGIEVQSYAFGTIGAFLAADRELGLTQTIAEVTGSRATALACLAFIAGRSEEPVSKNRMGEWFDRSVLAPLIPGMPSLSCRSYLYHMDKLPDDAVRTITFRLAQRMMALGHRPSTVFFDTTNFSTEMQPAPDDESRQLATPGHAKDFNLQAKIVGLATATTAEHLPVFHEVYPGKENDARLFQEVVDTMVDQLLKLGVASEELVFVFDKGMTSEAGWQALVRKQVHFVSSLKRVQAADLLQRPLRSYRAIYTTEQGEEIRGLRIPREVLGISGVIVLTYNASARKRQEKDYERAKRRFLTGVEEIAAKMSKPHRGRRSTVQSVTERIEDRIPKKWRGVFKYHVGASLDDGFTRFTVRAWVETKKEKILYAGFGKTVIFTDCKDWDDEKIVRTYFARSSMEEDYHVLKDVLLMPVMPIFHHMDTRVRVHAFLMVMGLLFYRWIQLKVKMPIDRLARELSTIRVAALMDAGTKRVKFVMERLTEEAAPVAAALGLAALVPK